MLSKKTSQKKKLSHLPKLIQLVGGDEIPNYKKQNKAMMSLFKVIQHKLDKALLESEKAEFEHYEVKQTHLNGQRKVLRDLLKLKPES